MFARNDSDPNDYYNDQASAYTFDPLGADAQSLGGSTAYNSYYDSNYREEPRKTMNISVSELDKLRPMKESAKSFLQPKKQRKFAAYICIFVLLAIFGALAVVFFVAVEDEATDNLVETEFPTTFPSLAPTFSPTPTPTESPTQNPTQNPTEGPTENPTESPTTFFPLFPTETRENSNYIGLMFKQPIQQSFGFDILAAADRWSGILAGTLPVFPTALVNEDQVFCDSNDVFSAGTVLDHLIVVFDILPDTNSAFDELCAVIGNVPTIGRIGLSQAALTDLQSQGILIPFITHSMGHILGIGILWPTFGLIANPLPGGFPNPGLPSPTYTGPNAQQAFNSIGGVGTLGIEDGFTNGLPNGAGPGLVNFHFDEDSMIIELMTFSINFINPPLSIVTISALQDFGYIVNAALADVFLILNNGGRSSVEQSQPLKNGFVVTSEVSSYVPVQLG